MNCTDKTKSAPSGLTIECSILSLAGVCKVRANTPAEHVIEVQNRSLIRYSIDIHGECETSRVRYHYGGCAQKTWNQTFRIGPRPGSGGPRKRSEAEELISLGPAENESIRTDLTWTPLGWSNSGVESLYTQLDTL
jgi:hypothetical protein